MKPILISLLVFFSIPAYPAKIKDSKCSDITTVNENITPQYLAVVDGYNKAGKKVDEEIDVGGIVSESKQVNEQCAKNQTQKISDIRQELKAASTAPVSSSTINPSKAKCQDFIALGEEVQPVAVFWVAGHNKAGKLEKGEVEEEFLTQPITTLVEDCKAHPQASFYSRTKNWLKKHV